MRGRQGLVVLLGFVALLGQSLPTLLPSAPALLHVGALWSSLAELVSDAAVEGDAGTITVDDPDHGDDLEDGGRNVTVDIRDGDVDIGLESNATDGGDEVKVQFGSVAAQLKVSFETLAPQQEEVEMRIEFRDLVEFEDRDGDGAFSPLDDDVLQWMRVETLLISKPPEASNVSVDSISGKQIDVSYGFPGSTTGAFDLIFQVFGLNTQIHGVSLRPTETKIDIRLTDFPFASATSLVALGLEIRTNFELEMDPGLRYDQINATGEEFAAFFRWMPEAVEVDGTPAIAEVSTVRERKAIDREGDTGEIVKELRLFLAYPRGSAIVHDPIVGIMEIAAIPPLAAPIPSLAVYVVGSGTALLLVIGLWALNRRRS